MDGWAFEPAPKNDLPPQRIPALLFSLDGYKVDHHLPKTNFHSKVDILADTDGCLACQAFTYHLAPRKTQILSGESYGTLGAAYGILPLCSDRFRNAACVPVLDK